MEDVQILTAKRENLRTRARMMQSVRDFFTDREYLEVETPNRVPAPAPEYHIDTLPSGTWFLHTSPELCMKRLLAAGISPIFQICKCYRHGERGQRHLPEFTLLEWYRAGAGYLNLMTECEELLRRVSSDLGNGSSLPYGESRIDLAPPWERLTVKDAF